MHQKASFTCLTVHRVPRFLERFFLIFYRYYYCNDNIMITLNNHTVYNDNNIAKENVLKTSKKSGEVT